MIDWLPSRTTASAFAIVGDFEDAVYCWRTQPAQWPDRDLGIILAAPVKALLWSVALHVWRRAMVEGAVDRAEVEAELVARARNLSMLAVPMEVLISVGHSEHSMTTTAEMTKLLARKLSSPLDIEAETTMVTIGNQASGLTGRITCTSGLIAALIRLDMPATSPSGTARR